MTQKFLYPPLILASASPRRKELLSEAGISFKIIPSHTDESSLVAEFPAELAGLLAEAKALDIAGKYPEHLVLGADTLVVVGNEILGKPNDHEDTRRMLRLLSGKIHQVITGVAIICAERGIHKVFTVSTDVRFRKLSEKEVEWYTLSGEPADKAGAYAIQGLAAQFIPEIHGSYANVVGLPICEVVEELALCGVFPENLPQ
ncbi:Maf family protein [Desulfococcaceae bacterium OttesenSCG-928-F15]|nr:Maf family protein [Desulfococcaceae bacterium OttesenSCG-928-F15]